VAATKDILNDYPPCPACGRKTYERHVHGCPRNFNKVPASDRTVTPRDNGGPPLDDVVVKPAHYARWAIEPITYIMRNGFEFWRGNATKYISRAGYKMYAGKTKDESEIIDLEKAIRCLQMRVNQINGETEL
jgi:hypothetical protein